ncbi:MAG: flavin reductase family protein [Candidatus Eremiobacteraeota bacterium]|nr:flavin reductase family protein [Candidatus Eremiobacteraeota bacterium]
MNSAPSVTDFKNAMRRFASGVTVVTSVREGTPRGVTVSSFSSVSLEPPSVLICINREARSYLFIATSRIFCVNVLSAGQRSLAERFSGKIREKQFADVDYYIDQTGAAVLEGALAHVDCEVLEEHHSGSHSIFIGKVISCSSHDGEPLGYFNGTFARFGIQTP